MKMELNSSLQILQNTPRILNSLLYGIGKDFINSNEGAGTWSPFDVVGHLIVCEQTNFMERIKIVLSVTETKQFKPIDMTAQFEAGKGKVMQDLLKEFEQLRNQNMEQLFSLQLSDSDFTKQAIHPKLGKVTLGNLLSTWVAHDLAHIAQITRVMAKQYINDVGPFIEFMPRLN
jgi:hypothetical protein